MKSTVGELLSATGGSLILGQPQTSFERLSIDTRTLLCGDAFFALHGPRFDGHAFVKKASEKNAAVLVIDRLDERLVLSDENPADVVLVEDSLIALQSFGAAQRQRSNAKVIGIAGSNGKTTTKEMLASILRQAGKTLATRGNLNNHIGLPLMCCEIEEDHRYVVLEMGTSKPGDMAVLMSIAAPEIGLITNVGKDHLEFLQTPEGVLKENRLLYDDLSVEGCAIVNLDDPLLAPLTDSLKVQTLTYSVHNEKADLFASDIRPWPLPLRFTLHLGGDSAEIPMNVPGNFQVSNALAAAAVAFTLKIPLPLIVQGLGEFKPAAMRMQVHEGKAGAVLINDAYNANPSSVRASVESFCQSFTDRPRWVVLGDMRELGEIARREHEAMGEWLASQSLDRIFLYGRDTRFMLEGFLRAHGKAVLERFKKKRFLTVRLEQELGHQKPAILFKASRSLKLEDVLAPLMSADESSTVKTH